VEDPAAFELPSFRKAHEAVDDDYFIEIEDLEE